MRGVTLDEISSATKISVRFLRAIEGEAFSELPGGIFTRSFIRTYSRYLGLDEERVLQEYLLVAKPGQDIDLGRVSSARQSSQNESSRTPLITFLVAVILLGGAYGLYRYSRQMGEIRTADTQPSQNTTAIATSTAPIPPEPAISTSAAQNESQPALSSSAAGTDGISSVAPVSPGATPGSTPSGNVAKPPSRGVAAASSPLVSSKPGTEPTASSDELVLQVAATERCWTAVEADGKTMMQRVLNPEEVVTFKARTSFTVTTGNALGVILTLNGNTLKPLGKRGEVKTVHLTRDSVKNSGM